MRSSFLLVCVALALYPSTTRAQTPPPSGQPAWTGAKWEYRVLTQSEISTLGKKDFTAGLNELGKDGWELSAIESNAAPFPGAPIGPGQPFTSTRYFFKRAVSGKSAPPAAKGNEEFKVFTLKHSDAVSIAKLLQELLKGDIGTRIKLAAHAESNSLIIGADPMLSETIEALIMRLEIGIESKKAPPPKKTDEPKKTGDGK